MPDNIALQLEDYLVINDALRHHIAFCVTKASDAKAAMDEADHTHPVYTYVVDYWTDEAKAASVIKARLEVDLNERR